MRSCSVLLCLTLLASCAHHRPVERLTAVDVSRGYRFLPHSSSNSDSLLVVLAFSGGGTRAAAFAHGVLSKLRDTHIVRDGKEMSLLDEVDVISSVSGGSVTAMYYGLFGEKIFQTFETEFLDQNVQGKLVRSAFLNPKNWFRLPARHFDRVDIAGEYFDRLFARKTFGDLPRERPLVVLNATDTTMGGRFEFTQDQFDLLCADLNSVPVGRGVAASAAFPFLLSPLTIEAYPRACGYQRPIWVDAALEERSENSRRFRQAQRLEHYLASDVRYVHLLDGGVSDNIGLRGIIQSLSSGDSMRTQDDGADLPRTLHQMINLEEINAVLVITANARTTSKGKRSRNSNAPQLFGVMSAVSTIPMGNYSFETVELLKESMAEWTRDVQSAKQCNQLLDQNCPGSQARVDVPHEVRLYAVELGFEAIEDPARRQRLLGLKTSFHLEPSEVDDVQDAAGDLLDASPRFQEFLEKEGRR